MHPWMNEDGTLRFHPMIDWFHRKYGWFCCVGAMANWARDIGVEDYANHFHNVCKDECNIEQEWLGHKWTNICDCKQCLRVREDYY